MTELQNIPNTRCRTLALACVLFTLVDKDPTTNTYLRIFTMWLSQLRSAGGLTHEDALYISVDNRTLNELQTNSIFGRLAKQFPCPIHIRQYRPPKTLLEGMLWKYDPPTYTQDAYMYCDIDILVTRDLHTLLATAQNESLLLHHEEYLKNPDYGGVVLHEGMEIDDRLPGFSAGKFIIVGHDLCFEFMHAVKTFAEAWTGGTFYTCEQPFFNKLIYSIDVSRTHIDTETLTDDTISQNGYEFKAGYTVLLDCMGEPGNQHLHFTKILDSFTLLRCSEQLLV